MHAGEQTQYVDYAFNSSYVTRKQNKTHVYCAKKRNFTAVNIGSASNIGIF